jgi:Protein of unknown function (DUF3631)
MLSPEERRRAISWLLDMVADIRGSDFRDEGADRVWQGGFAVHRTLGWAYNFATGDGATDPVTTVRLVQTLPYTHEQAEQWIRRYLGAHPGLGPVTGNGDGDAAGVAAAVSKARAEDVLARAVAVEGTPGEIYLRSRRLEPPYPFDTVRLLPDARVGEHALVGILRANGRITGLELRFITADGSAKSHRRITVQRWNLEKAADAVFELPAPEKLDNPTTDLAIFEGLPDLLSSQALYARNFKCIGLPGIGALQHIKVARGTKVTVVKHGDTADDNQEAAIAGLVDGIDSLILQHATVSVVPTPDGEDFNSILGTAGPAAAIKLFAAATQIPLSRHGEIERLSRLAVEDFEIESRKEAARLGMSLTSLHRAVSARRRERQRLEKLEAAAAAAARTGAVPKKEDPPWTEEINLGVALNSTYQALLRYIDMSPTHAAICTLWTAMAHLVHKTVVALSVCPRLAIGSLFPDSGKTTLLVALGELVPDAEAFTSYSGSAIFRIVDATRATLLLDECDQVLRDPSGALMEVLNGSHYRRSARVVRVEVDITGQRHVTVFSTWCAIAFAGLGRLPRTLDSRSIKIRLDSARPDAGLSSLEDGTARELVDCRRHFGAWANTLREPLPKPTLPAVLRNRSADNWRPLFAIAALAADDWPERIRQAAEDLLQEPRPQTRLHELLHDVREVFLAHIKDLKQKGEEPEPARLPSRTLFKALNEEFPESGWYRRNNGAAIDEYWLREQLRDVLSPRGSQQWREPARPGQKNPSPRSRGYYLHQFEDVFARYLDPPQSEDADDTADDAKKTFSPPYGGIYPGHPGHARTSPEQFNPVPDVPDAPASLRGKTFSSREAPADLPSDQESENAAETLENGGVGAGNGAAGPPQPTRRTRKHPGQAQRPEGAKHPGQDPVPDPGPTMPPGDVIAHIQQLRRDYPTRSLAWIADKAGQRKSVVVSVLGEVAGPGEAP